LSCLHNWQPVDKDPVTLLKDQFDV
jgi:hypothetical protein